MRIMFSMTSRYHLVDVKRSIIGWIVRNMSEKIGNIADLTLPVPKGYSQSYLPRIVQSIDLDETAMEEHLLGILIKLKIKTFEKKIFRVFGSSDGWFVEGGKHYLTLSQLLCSLSPGYQDSYFMVSTKWCALDQLERVKYDPINRTTVFEPNDAVSAKSRRSKIMNLGTPKIMVWSLDETLDALKGDDPEDLFLKKVEDEFLQQVREGIELIKKGTLLPTTDSGNYMWRDLFITRLDGLQEYYADRGGLEAAAKSLRNEIKLYPALAHLQDDVKVTHTILIDYFGERWVAQTLIPGLLNRQAKIVYGLDPVDRSKFMTDDFFSEFFKKNSDQLGILPSSITRVDTPIYSSSEANGVFGRDGMKYIVDMHRITPRDANYPDPQKHHACIVRSAAIHSFEMYTALIDHKEELLAMGGEEELSFRRKPNSDPLPDDGDLKLAQRRKEIMESAAKMQFDINALTVDSASTTIPENIQKLAKFIVDKIIPNYVDETLADSSFIFDGCRIVDEMHGRGINVRYLGRITELVKAKEDTALTRATVLVLESEMVARSFKTIVRNGPNNLNTFLNQLNLLLGLAGEAKDREQILAQTKTVCQEKFAYTIEQVTSEQKMLILKSVALSFGMTIRSTILEHPLTLVDVVSIEPVLTYSPNENLEMQVKMDMAIALHAEGNADEALQLFVSIVHEHESHLSPFDKRLGLCYFYIAMLSQRAGHAQNAMNAMLRSLIIHEKYCDQLHPEIIVRYAALSSMAHDLGKLPLSYACAARAAHLAHLLCPIHPWVLQAFVSAGEIATTFDISLALLNYQFAASLGERIRVDNETLASIYHRMSFIYLSLDWNKSIQCEERACQLSDAETYKSSLAALKEHLQHKP